MYGKKLSILKEECFSGKGRQYNIIHVMKIRRMLISCVKLDHTCTLYSINYARFQLVHIHVEVFVIIDG